MIDITASAMEELRAIKESGRVCCNDDCQEVACSADEAEVALRLVSTEDGHVALILDVCQEGDTVVEYEGAKVLLIDAEMIDIVDGFKFDCIETPEGRRLEIYSPEE